MRPCPQASPAHGPARGEAFPGEGVVSDDQHGPTSGHLPAVNRNVRVVGTARVNHAGGIQGRVADVAAYGNHAFLTAFGTRTARAAERT